MSRNLKVLFAALLIVCVFATEKICEHLGFGQASSHETQRVESNEKEMPIIDSVLESDNSAENTMDNTTDSSADETIYRWDEQLTDWVPAEELKEFQAQLVDYTSDVQSSGPIELDWKVLMNIEYKLKYFEQVDAEMYAPVFGNAVKSLDGKEVIIEGFVIPLDQEGEILSLSFNPYASCFFCGKASPASVVSMYLKNKSKRYYVDDFRKFKGTLHLNFDDPNEFYYILRNAKEVK